MNGEVTIRILEIEGLDLDLDMLSCYIYHDRELINVVSPLTAKQTELPDYGIIRLQIKTIATDPLLMGSVSFSPLKRSTFWLPLFSSSEQDFAADSVTYSNRPRVQVSISDSPFISEDDLFGEGMKSLSLEESSSHTECWLQRFQGLQKKIIDLEHNLESERWQFQREVDSLSHSHRCKEESQNLALEHYNMLLTHERAIKQDLISQITVLKEKVHSLERLNCKANERADEITAKYEESLAKHESAYKQHSTTLLGLKSEITSLSTQNSELRLISQSKDSEKSILYEKIDVLKAKLKNMKGENFKGQAELLKRQLEESEKQRESLREQLEKLQANTSLLIDKFRVNERSSHQVETENLQNQLAEMQIQAKERQLEKLDLETENARLSVELEKARKEVQRLNKSALNTTSSDFGQADFLFDKIINDKGVSQYFEQVRPGTYLFRSKELNLSVNNEAVQCCFEGEKMSVEEFIEQRIGVSPLEYVSSLTPSFKKKILENYQCKHTPKRRHEHDNHSCDFDVKDGRLKVNARVKPTFQIKEKNFEPIRRSSDKKMRKNTHK